VHGGWVGQRGGGRSRAASPGRAEGGFGQDVGADGVDPAQQPRTAGLPEALDDALGRLYRSRDVAGQRAGDPVDRRAAGTRIGQALAVEAAGQDQPLPRAGHRHVEQPPLLLRLLPLLEARQPVPVERGHELAAADRCEPQADAAVAAQEQLVARGAGLTAEVGHADDRELESFGAVDRHQAHGVESLGLQRRLAFTGLDEILGRGVGDEAAEVRPLRLLVLARQPHELAQVGQPALPA
jgi:hypothetical protein